MKNLILSSFKFGKTKGLLLEGIEESSFLRGLLGEVSCIEPICLFSCICCIHGFHKLREWGKDCNRFTKTVSHTEFLYRLKISNLRVSVFSNIL